jgi:hypothetical protein
LGAGAPDGDRSETQIPFRVAPELQLDRGMVAPGERDGRRELG